MIKWKYSIEVRRLDGKWSHGIICACYPNEFRRLLYYVEQVIISSTRIRRVSDKLKPDFQWPDKK